MSPWDHCNGDRDHDQPGQILGFQPAEINRPLIFPGGGWGVSTSTWQYGLEREELRGPPEENPCSAVVNDPVC